MDFLLKCFNVLNEGFQGCMFLCLLLIIVYVVYLFILLVFVFTVSISSLFIIRKTLKGTTKHLQTSNEYSKTLNHKLSSWRQNLESIQDFHALSSFVNTTKLVTIDAVPFASDYDAWTDV